MFACATANRVLVHAPAKLNLFLDVLARRADGFHEIETLMGAITLFDTLEFTPRSDGVLRLHCRWAGGMAARMRDGRSGLGDLPQGERNLVYRAVERLRESSQVNFGADIRLIKRIPAAAGMGGASSDAAAALLAASTAWKLPWSRQRLAELAAELGSDIPFFLTGGFAICRGRGERIEPIRGSRIQVVIVRPPEGLSTADVYRRWQAGPPRADVRQLQRSLMAHDWHSGRQQLTNRLQEPAAELTPWIGKLTSALQRAGCVAAQMSGSGSSCFGICHSARHARRVTLRLRAQKLGEVFQAAGLGAVAT